ncbi:MAG: phage holin family protein [Lawsonibacter sp.]|jgi:hypothetical protein
MDLMELGVAAIPAITVLCYLAGCVCRASNLDNTWIPAVLGILGAALGVASMWIMPEFPGQDYITAAAIGAVSGFAATGINQVMVQAGKRQEKTV